MIHQNPLKFGFLFVLVALLAVGMLGGATAAESDSSLANDSVVADGNTSDAVETDCDPCFLSFQQMVDFIDDGDTYYPAHGEFEDESADMYRDDIRIIGDRSWGESFIWYEPDDPTDRATLEITGDNVLLETYDVERFVAPDRDESSPPAAAIEVTGEDATLEDLRLNGTGAETPGVYGVYVAEGASVTIDNSTFNGFETAIYPADDAEVTVGDDNEFNDVGTEVAGESSPLDAYANGDGEIDVTGVSEAIDDWRTGEIDVSTVSDAIDIWRTGDRIS